MFPRSQTGPETYLTSYPVATQVSFLRVEADNSPLSSAKDKNGGVIPSFCHMSLLHSG
jgi:hypothetical protein